MDPQSEPITAVSFKNLDDCHVNAVVGGLAAIQALLEKDTKAQNFDILSLFISTIVPIAPSTNTSSCDYSYTDNVSPPSVEKYVLNETFLI